MSLKIQNISKTYGQQKALDSISFTIGKGELVGFLGPNGAGKSTMMKIITGFIQASSGEVFVNENLSHPENSEIRNTIGYLPENNPLYTELYVKEYLGIAAGFYHLKNRWKAVDKMVEITGLGNEQHKKIKALSKGYRQRVGLAQALIHDPSVLILDEPTTGLDPNQLEDIRQLIKNVSREKTVLFSTHIMQEVEAVCDRAIIINNGKIVANGNIDDLKKKNFKASQIVKAEFNKKINKEKLLAITGVANVTYENGVWLLEAKNKTDIRKDIFNFAVENQLILLTLSEKQQNLENVFFSLTN